MGLDFAEGNPDYLEASSAVISGTPCTMACWFNAGDTGLNRMIECSTASSEGDVLSLYCDDPVLVCQQYTSGNSATATVGTMSAGTLYHGAGVWASDSSRTAYLDGSAGTENTSARSAAAGMDRTAIGVLHWTGAGRIQGMEGLIYEASIWNEALTAAEIAALAAGVSASQIRPHALVMYQPMRRGADEGHWGPTMTLSGTTVVNHIPMYYPTRPHIITAPGGAPPAGDNILPQMIQHGLYAGNAT